MKSQTRQAKIARAKKNEWKDHGIKVIATNFVCEPFKKRQTIWKTKKNQISVQISIFFYFYRPRSLLYNWRNE